MLEYGYMLALNKPPALVRMVPFTEEGDGSSFWERRIIGNGTVLYTPQGGLGLALNGFKDVGAQPRYLRKARRRPFMRPRVPRVILLECKLTGDLEIF